jgi:hypothetical protein
MKDSLNQKWRLGGNVLTTNTVFGTNSDHELIFVRNGIRAGLINSSLVNTSFGLSSLQSNTTGSNNTANGVNALYFNTTGYNNTASGASTLKSNTTGYNNTASGLNALFFNTTGYNNTASGLSALFYSTTGYNNTASGVNALFFNTTGNNNTASGLNALLYGKTGSNNTVLLSREDGIVRSIIADSSMNNTLVLGAGGDIRIFSDSTGNTGFGTTTPTNKLHVVGTNPVRLEGLQTGALTDQLVTVDATGVFKQRTVSDVTNYSSYAAISSSTTYTSTSPNITKTTGTITVTLPTASSAANKSFTFVKSDISTVLTIQANGSETINNANFITSNSQWDRITLFSTSTEWLVIGQ